ncbi:MAG: hypothetical protein AB1705_15945 [Verrucomicrobiota bacterium]
MHLLRPSLLLALFIGGAISLAAQQQKVANVRSAEETAAASVLTDIPGGGKWVLSPLVPGGDAREPHQYSMRSVVTRGGVSYELTIAFERKSYPNFDSMQDGTGKAVEIKPFIQRELGGRKVESHVIQLSLPYLQGLMKDGLELTFKGRREKTMVKIPAYFFRGFVTRVSEVAAVVNPPPPKEQPQGTVGDDSPSLNEVFGGQITNAFPLLAREKLIGHSFVFMPVPFNQQALAYRLYRNSAETFQLRYTNYVGKTLHILSAHLDQFGGVIYNTKVQETGESFQVYEGIPRTFPYLVLKRDIEEARRLYQGQTLWLNQRRVFTYNPTDDKVDVEVLPKLDPVLVQRVVLGTLQNPVRFIFADKNDKTHYLDVAMSLTDSDGADVRLFADTFLTFSPRERFKWPASVFEAISNEKVHVGMTADQVLLAWGKPRARHRASSAEGTTERWVYEQQTVYISNGICTGVQ